MTKPRKHSKPGTPKWSSDWSVGVRVSVDRRGKPVLEEPVADLLMALDRTRSISAAARTIGISYRHAWLLIDEANRNAGAPLTATAIGGQRGGGAQLTEHGRAAVAVFQQVQQQIRAAAVKALPKILATATDESAVIHLSAAISLQEAIAQIVTEYALIRPTLSVRTIFGASNELADQIAASSPADVFVSASGSHISRLAKAGLIVASTRHKLASNGLVIVGGASLVGKLRKPADLRKLQDYRIVVADPACPLGKCSAEFLKTNDLLEDLRPRMLLVDNSRAVVTSMRAGDTRLGIIFGSDVANAAGLTTLLAIPESQIKTIYEGAVIAGSAVADEAAALLEFFASKPAQRVFRRCGFSA